MRCPNVGVLSVAKTAKSMENSVINACYFVSKGLLSKSGAESRAKMIKKTAKIWAFFILFMFCCMHKVLAHPHVFVDASIVLNVEEDKIMSVTQTWTFGEMFSATLTEDYDTNADGKYDEKELKVLKYEAFDNLAESKYFTYINVNGQSVDVATEVGDFNASIDDKGFVTYHFTTKLTKPINIKDINETNIGIYDPEYFIDISYALKDKVKFVGIPESKCSYEVKEDKENPTYYGMVFPRKVYFSCKDL